MRTGLTVLAWLGIVTVSGCGPHKTAGPDPAAEARKVDAKLNEIPFPKEHDEAKLREVTLQMNSIDISRCPQDYQAAYVQFASAVGDFIDYCIETNSWEYSIASGLESFLRGMSGDPFGLVREERERRRQLHAKLREAVASYRRTLAKYKQ